MRIQLTKIVITAALSLALAFTFGCSKDTVKSSEATGTKRIVDAPELELEKKLSEKQRESIPWGIGTGISTDRQMARTESIAYGQAAVARSAKAQLNGLLKTYQKNVNEQPNKMTEELMNNYVDTQLEGSYVFETIMEFDENSKKYSVYTLVLLNPEKIESGLSTVSKEELELRYDRQKMQEEIDRRKAEYRNLVK